MPAPSSSLATLRPDLMGSVEEFNLLADRQGFIGLKVLPSFDVPEQGNTFGRIPVEQLLKNTSTDRTSKGGYARDDFQFEDDSYATKERGAECPVDDRLAKMYRHYFDAEQVAARRAVDRVLRNQEKRIADAIFNTTTFGSATNVSNEWDDHANATPVDDVLASKLRVYAACGLWPDSLIITRATYLHLRECAQIVDRLKYAGIWDPSRPVTVEALAQVFDLRQVLVAGGTKNTANEGQTAAFSEIWNDEYAAVCKVAETNDIAEPCLGRTFHWTADGSMIDCLVETYRDETARADIVRARHEVAEKIIYTEAIDLIGNVTTN